MANNPKEEESKESKQVATPKTTEPTKSQEPLECFVIMPISTPEGYGEGHFNHVYKDIFKPACEMAGFRPVRADEITDSNFIQLDILKRLLEAPMAICDLSSANPNVMYELGVRQAFDKPVALVQEEGTRRIFDIDPLRYVSYKRGLTYRDVVLEQKNIATAIKTTFEAHSGGKSINSLVKLLSLIQPASLVEVSEADKDPIVQLVRAEISALRQDVAQLTTPSSRLTSSTKWTGTIRLPKPASFSTRGVGLGVNVNNLKRHWKMAREDIMLNMPVRLAHWLSYSEIESVNENEIRIIIRAQDYPEQEDTEIIQDHIAEYVGVPCTITYKGIPSQ